MQLRGGKDVPVALLYSASRKDEVPRHEGVVSMTLSEQHLRLASRTIDQDQTGGVAGLRIGIRKAVSLLSDSCEIVHSMSSKPKRDGLSPRHLGINNKAIIEF
jgi:hypothetical protein